MQAANEIKTLDRMTYLWTVAYLWLLCAGPGGLLGAVEGFSYALIVTGAAVLGFQVAIRPFQRLLGHSQSPFASKTCLKSFILPPSFMR